MIFKFWEKLFPQKYLGIDIGTSSIKVVEISRWGKGKTLENYGYLKAKSLYQGRFETFEKTTLLLSPENVSRAIKAILKEAGIKERAAVFSLPDFSTFFLSLELPPMRKEEIKEAIYYSAPSYLPLPSSEVNLDFYLTSGEPSTSLKKGTKLKVLVIAVPKEVILRYKDLAQLTNLELYALESEVSGLVRAYHSQETVAIFDLGAHSSTVNIARRNLLIESHSLDFSGNMLTRAISKAFEVPFHIAEEMKIKYGLYPSKEKISSVIYPQLDLFLKEAKNILSLFENSTKEKIKKIILSGGGAKMKGLSTYVSEVLKKEVEILNPFKNLLYPPELEKVLERWGSIFSVAVGMSFVGLEKI